MARVISTSVHTAVEVIAAPAVMAAPFVLGFGQTAALVTFILGAVLLGHALAVEGPRRTMPLSAHAGIDYMLATFAIAAGLGLAVAAGQWGPGIFLVGVGVAQVMLTASTRFSVPLRA